GLVWNPRLGSELLGDRRDAGGRGGARVLLLLEGAQGGLRRDLTGGDLGSDDHVRSRLRLYRDGTDRPARRPFRIPALRLAPPRLALSLTSMTKRNPGRSTARAASGRKPRSTKPSEQPPDAPPQGVLRRRLSASGHLIDSGMMSKYLNTIIENGGTYELHRFDIGKTLHDYSTVELSVAAPDQRRLD